MNTATELRAMATKHILETNSIYKTLVYHASHGLLSYEGEIKGSPDELEIIIQSLLDRGIKVTRKSVESPIYKIRW